MTSLLKEQEGVKYYISESETESPRTCSSESVAQGTARVVLIDTQATITVEDECMLQAKYSRSPNTILEHIKGVRKSGSGKFMSMFYVGYGHKSIADCGHATLYVENVSMLCAKALQDFPLYGGQEVSTRYVDFNTQPLSPYIPAELEKEYRAFYRDSFPAMVEHLKSINPITEGTPPAQYQKAINAAAFDVLRGFLPAGTLTSLAIHTSLRQFGDMLKRWRHHPLAEVRDVSARMEDVLRQAYPNSFGHKLYPDTEAYNAMVMRDHYYFNPSVHSDFSFSPYINASTLHSFTDIIEARPAHTELPHFINEAGTVHLEFLMDYGSYRDLQRHRSVTQRMPLLTSRFGFEQWYLDSLAPSLVDKAKALLEKAREVQWIRNPHDDQYILSMGYRVPVRITGGLASMVYIAELRSGPTVHPTLRRVAIKMGEYLKTRLGIKVHLDQTPAGLLFSVQRGKQDIVEKV